MESLLVPPSKGRVDVARRRLSFRRSDHQRWPGTSKTVQNAGENVTEVITKTLLWTEIEEWQQRGSDHIETGYRRANSSVKDCLLSWTYLHNETVNIYSHIIGAFLFLIFLPGYFLTVTIPPRYHVATPTEVVACGTYLVGVAVCFALSTAFHTLMAHSEAVYLVGMKLDIQGVLVLMWGATVPLAYYAYPCEAYLRASYLGLFTVLAGLCSAVTFLPRFSGPHLGPYRAALFGSFGAGSFALPIGHGVMRYGMGEMWNRVGMKWILATVLCNGIGVGVYGMKFPERWFPRRFDFFGASHQLMHIFVVAAALTYTCAIVEAFDYRHKHGLMCEG